MPELVNSKVASPPGTSDMDGTAVCPCSTKKSIKSWRIWLPVSFLLMGAPRDFSGGIIPRGAVTCWKVESLQVGDSENASRRAGGWFGFELSFINESGSNYDSFAKTYDFLVSQNWYNRLFWGTTADEYENFHTQAIRSNAKVMIDLGCGSCSATWAEYQSDGNSQITLIDNSIEMLRVAKTRLEGNGQKHENIKLFHADAFATPIESGNANIVNCFGFLHIFDNKEAILNEIHRLLDKNGQVNLSCLITGRKFSEKYMRFLRERKEFGELIDHAALLKLMGKSFVITSEHKKGSMSYVAAKKA